MDSHHNHSIFLYQHLNSAYIKSSNSLADSEQNDKTIIGAPQLDSKYCIKQKQSNIIGNSNIIAMFHNSILQLPVIRAVDDEHPCISQLIDQYLEILHQKRSNPHFPFSQSKVINEDAEQMLTRQANLNINKQLSLLCKIKNCILSNPYNFNNTIYGCLSSVQIYEFIIQCLSNQQVNQQSGLLYNTMSLMVKLWVTSPEEFKMLYDGILSLIQQRQYCIDNCLLFLTEFLDVLQQYKHSESEVDHRNSDNNSKIYANFEQYFINHILNQIIGLSNIFLDRAVVRNCHVKQNRQESQNQMSFTENYIGPCHPLQTNSTSLPHKINNDEQSQQQSESDLYKICASQQHIFLLLQLIEKCITYDFQQINRRNQDDIKMLLSSQIILPTKFSKHSKFQEFDLFLKQQHIAEMLNYLYLVLKSQKIKAIIVRLLVAMSKVHFRYFKNKMSHRIYLENLVVVVSNLIIGLNFDVNNSDSCSYLPAIAHKIETAIGFGQIVNILLYHQPTIYTLDSNLIENLIELIHTFILNQLFNLKLIPSTEPESMEPINQQPQLSSENSSHEDLREKKPNLISVADFLVLVDLFVNLLPKVQIMCSRYLHDNQKISDLLNDVIFIVGKNYRDYLRKYVTSGSTSFLIEQLPNLQSLKLLLEFFKVHDPKFSLPKLAQNYPQLLYHQHCQLLLDWLTNFHHKLYSTVSHHNHPSSSAYKEWQIQNYYEQLTDLVKYLCNQLLSPANSVNEHKMIKISEEQSLLKFYILIISYVNEKIMEECKTFPSQYLQQMGYQFAPILQWILRNQAYDRQLVCSTISLLYSSQTLPNFQHQIEDIAQLLISDTNIYQGIFRKQQIQLIAEIIVNVVPTQLFEVHLVKFQAMFGLTLQQNPYPWVQYRDTRYMMLMYVMDELEHGNNIYYKKNRYSQLLKILNKSYIVQTSLTGSQSLICMANKSQYVNSQLITILTKFIQLQVVATQHQSSINLFCRIAPLYLRFIRNQLDCSVFQRNYCGCLRSLNKFVMIGFDHIDIIKYLNLTQIVCYNNQTPTSKQVLVEILESLVLLLVYPLMKPHSFLQLTKQECKKLIKQYIKCIQTCLSCFPFETIFKTSYRNRKLLDLSVDYGTQNKMMGLVIDNMFKLIHNYQMYYYQDWITTIGPEIYDQIISITIKNSNLHSQQIHIEDIVIGKLITSLRKQTINFHKKNFINFYRIIDIIERYHEVLSNLMDEHAHIIKEEWDLLYEMMGLIDQKGIKVVIENLFKTAKMQVYQQESNYLDIEQSGQHKAETLYTEGKNQQNIRDLEIDLEKMKEEINQQKEKSPMKQKIKQNEQLQVSEDIIFEQRKQQP